MMGRARAIAGATLLACALILAHAAAMHSTMAAIQKKTNGKDRRLFCPANVGGEIVARIKSYGRQSHKGGVGFNGSLTICGIGEPWGSTCFFSSRTAPKIPIDIKPQPPPTKSKAGPSKFSLFLPGSKERDALRIGTYVPGEGLRLYKTALLEAFAQLSNGEKKVSRRKQRNGDSSTLKESACDAIKAVFSGDKTLFLLAIDDTQFSQLTGFQPP